MESEMMALALLQTLIEINKALYYLTVAVSTIPVSILFSILLSERRARRALDLDLTRRRASRSLAGTGKPPQRRRGQVYTYTVPSTISEA